jgi:hypothetical protein
LYLDWNRSRHVLFLFFVSAALPAAAIIVKNQKRAEERETKGADIL